MSGVTDRRERLAGVARSHGWRVTKVRKIANHHELTLQHMQREEMELTLTGTRDEIHRKLTDLMTRVSAR